MSLTRSNKPRQTQQRRRGRRSHVGISLTLLAIAAHLNLSSAISPMQLQHMHRQEEGIVITSPPVTSPTPPPTPFPTFSPTYSPTPLPTLEPTPSPTTAQLTKSPTPAPIISPIKQDNQRVQNIVVTLTGVEPLTEEDKIWFQDQTKEYIEFYYNEQNNRERTLSMSNDGGSTIMSNDGGDGSSSSDSDRHRDRRLELQGKIYDVETFIDVTGMDPPFFPARRLRLNQSRETTTIRKRKLQDETLSITYDQVISYKTQETSELNLELIMTEPFNNILKRINYGEMYLQGGDGVETPEAFRTLGLVQLPKVQQEEPETKQVSIALIVGASGGGVALALVIGILCWMRKREKQPGQNKKMPNKRKRGNGSDAYNGSSAPTSQVNLNLSGGDEVSTLVDPPQQLGIYTNQASLNGFNRDEPSIGTFDPDPDYHGVYGGADNSIVSSVGATLSSQTQKSRFSAAPGHGIYNNGGGGSIYTADDQSFEQYFRNQQDVPERQEEILEVFAPAGKLGVVIDTPNNGVPVVHNIKESCPIKDQLQVGDRLIAVDDEDVRNMTAVMVSKLISQKSSNETRKFTVGRVVMVGAGANGGIS